MSEDTSGLIQMASAGGVAARHPRREGDVALIAPTNGEEWNTIKAGLVAVACWRVDDLRFEFDSSIVGPQIAKEMKHLAHLVKAHPGCPLSVFGHADPVGGDDYNKVLSGRRAIAIYAMLTRNDKLWEELYSQPVGNDKWGTKAAQVMLTGLGFDTVGTSGATEADTLRAVKDFQTNQGVSPSGQLDQATRKRLFLAYMDQMCGPDLKLKKQDFLARGDDPGGKGDYQGCSEFNPLLLFSKAESQQFEQEKDQSLRNAANAPNRRVVILLFRKGTRVTPAKWPCPRAKEGLAGCRKRFWSDGEKRRANQEQRRQYQQTHDTFACRFYDRLVTGSPCERILAAFRIRLFDRLAKPIPGAPFVVILEGNESPLDYADENGDIVLHDIKVPSTCTVRWSRPKTLREIPPGPKPDLSEFQASLRADGLSDEEIKQMQDAPPLVEGFEFELDVFIDLEEATESQAAKEPGSISPADQKRLHNLGYSVEEEWEDNLRAFQRDCEATTGSPPADVIAELRKRHQQCDPPLRLRLL
jgi:hypothetical protein